MTFWHFCFCKTSVDVCVVGGIWLHSEQRLEVRVTSKSLLERRPWFCRGCLPSGGRQEVSSRGQVAPWRLYLLWVQQRQSTLLSGGLRMERVQESRQRSVDSGDRYLSISVGL